MMRKETINENLKILLEQEMKNLVITHSPNIESDYLLSGEMDKYYFDYPCKMSVDGDELVLLEEETDEKLCLDLSKVTGVSSVSDNNGFVFPQERVCAMMYGEEIITFYFD